MSQVCRRYVRKILIKESSCKPVVWSVTHNVTGNLMQNDMIIHNTNDANKKHIYIQYPKRFEKYLYVYL